MELLEFQVVLGKETQKHDTDSDFQGAKFACLMNKRASPGTG